MRIEPSGLLSAMEGLKELVDDVEEEEGVLVPEDEPDDGGEGTSTGEEKS